MRAVRFERAQKILCEICTGKRFVRVDPRIQVFQQPLTGILCKRQAVYKQQIGRALSANARREPLILDIVANVYNLFSVDSLQGEIAETVRLLTQKGEGVKIVVDGFTVYDLECAGKFGAVQRCTATGNINQ